MLNLSLTCYTVAAVSAMRARRAGSRRDPRDRIASWDIRPPRNYIAVAARVATLRFRRAESPGRDAARLGRAATTAAPTYRAR